MAGLNVPDWVSNPLQIVKNLFTGNIDKHLESVKEDFKSKIDVLTDQSLIPTLNITQLHDIPNNSLVRLRCMVQDMYDPEFYMGSYDVCNEKNEKRMVSGLFTDIVMCESNEVINYESPQNVTMDRCTYSCIPIPGENDWVKNVKASKLLKLSHHQDDVEATVKRKIEETENRNDDSVMDVDQNVVAGFKRLKCAENEKNVSREQYTENRPIPHEKGISFLVKVYDSCEIKLNDILEIYGILSIDPALASFDSQVESVDELTNMEQKFHNPPPSLVPRVHAVVIQHNDQHLHSIKINAYDNETEICSVREDLLSLLSQIVFGDRLAGELLLCHLISGVYSRRDFLPIGNFSLNLAGCPAGGTCSRKIYDMLQNLVTKSHFVPLSIDNLNKDNFSPKKNYSENRLKSGHLQLSSSTHLIIDETTMKNGHLDVQGVKNLTALGNVAKWQKVVYDFEYHQQDFECDIPLIVFSEGKSLIQCECIIYLNYDSNINIENHFSEILKSLDDSKLDKYRQYISHLKLRDYELSETVKKVIEEDFVALRKEDPKTLSVDAMHALLVLARLLSISYGKSHLDLDCWKRAKVLDTLRKQRTKHSTAPSL